METTTTRRYIATTRKHEHKFTISAELSADVLPVYQYRGHDLRGWFMNGSVMWRGECPNCGKLVTIPANVVIGKYSSSRECDERCTSATGNTCNCHCSGRNHGADYAA